jgi:succinate dehydrogenase hydrophobic anchor subunit
MSINSTQVHLAHITVIGPLLLYVGFAREDVPDAVFHALGIAAVTMLGYHAYRAYTKLKENKSAWVNWIHIFLVAPLLLIVAYLKKDASRRYFEMLLLLGFAAVGYHGLYLIRESIFN